MARKPYQQQQAKNWYMASRFYQCYMLRELTSITTALAALNLFWGLATLAGSLESWQTWLAFQKNPLMILINLVVIIGSLFNSKTWFEAMPKAVKIPKGNGFVEDKILILGSWAALGGVAFVLLILVICLA